MGFMQKTGSHEAYVEEGGETSVVNLRDLLGVTILETKLSTLMRRVPTLDQNSTLKDAASLMFEQRSRSVPVRGRRFSVVNSASVAAQLVEAFPKAKASSLMSPRPLTIEPTSPASKARSLMLEEKIDQVPIVDGAKLKGVITSEQILFNLMPRADEGSRRPSWARLDGPVGRFPIDDVVTDQVTSTAKDVFENISDRRASYSLLMDGEELSGIITLRDFMKLAPKSEAPSLPMYIVGLPDDPIEAAGSRAKFAAAVGLLEKTFPDISEVRALVKTSKSRVEVKVLVLSPTRRYSYDVSSHSLLDAFEKVHAWAKKAVSEYKPNRRRKVERPEFPD